MKIINTEEARKKYPQSDFGDMVKIGYNVQIGNKTVIGKKVYIDDNVQIGNNTGIRNHVDIYENAKIGDDVCLGDNLIIQENTHIGNGVIIACNVRLNEGVIIEDCARLREFTVIGKNAKIKKGYEGIVLLGGYHYNANVYYDFNQKCIMIRLGCYIRKLSEWDKDFHNNKMEFPIGAPQTLKREMTYNILKEYALKYLIPTN